VKERAGKILVVGGDGTIGRALCAELLARGLSVTTTSRRAGHCADIVQLDLVQDPEDWLPPSIPDLAFLCAGVTGLAACAQDPAGTARINVGHVLSLARRLAGLGCRVVYPSTNLVLDGNRPFLPADSPLRPACEYGRQKAEVERQLAALGPLAAVLRMTKVLPPKVPLLCGWAKSLRAGECVRPLSDLVMAPVPLLIVVEALIRIGLRGGSGIYQVSGDRDVSYAEAAAMVARRLGCSPSLIRPATADEIGVTLEAAPRHTTLDPSRAEAELGIAAIDVARTIAGIPIDDK